MPKNSSTEPGPAREGINNREMRMRSIALFAAFSMFAATLEYLFPRPVPFFRLGLANLPIIMAFPILDFPSLIVLTLLKVLGQALINGTLASYVFLLSLTGSFASFFIMYGLYRLAGRRISYLGISLGGALASNTVQSVFSVLVIFGEQAWVILPLFYGLGFAAGMVIGVLAEILSRRSRWFFREYLRVSGKDGPARLSRYFGTLTAEGAGFFEATGIQDSPPGNNPGDTAKSATARRRTTRFPSVLVTHLSTPGAFAAGVLSIPLYLLATEPLARIIQVVILGVLTLMAGKRLFYAYFIFLMLSVTFFHILIPQGRVLGEIAGFAITEGALLSGLYRGSTIIGLVFLSLFSIRRDLHIPGNFGNLVSRTLRYFEHIYEYRRAASIGGLVQRLDRVLFELSDSPPEDAGDSQVKRLPRAADWPVILLIVASLALPLLLQTGVF